MRIFFAFTFILISFFSFAQQLDSDSLKTIAEDIRQGGHILFNKKKYDIALIEYHKALESFISLQDSTSIAKCYNNIGNAQISLGNDEKAIEYYYKAIELNKFLNLNSVLIGNYINLASYYYKHSDFDLAVKYYIEAKNSVSISNNGSRLAWIYMGLGIVLSEPSYESHNFELARDYYQKGLEKYLDIDDSVNTSFIYNNLGVLMSRINKSDSSLFYYEKSLLYKNATQDSREHIITYLNIGNIYLDRNDFDTALEFFNKGATLSLNFDDDVNYLQHLTNILKCKIRLGESEEADSLLEIYYSLNDSIYDKERAKNLKELEVLYETQKIGNDLKDQIKQTEAKTRLSYWYLALAVGIALLFVITILFFIQNRKYQQTLKERELESLKKAQEIKELNAMMQGQEEERNRIAEDLHDRLGARLSAIKLLTLNNGQKNSSLSEMVEDAIKETREISHNLSTDMLTRFGLSNAIGDFVRTVNESNQIEGDFTTTNLEERLPKIFEKTIFHIVLELVNNTIRHSGASSFFIQLTRYENEIDLIYEDDGEGFDAKQSTFTGMGMKNLTARVESIKGKINFDSMPGKGVQVVMSASLNEVLVAT